jgi:hypothetical protein
VRSVRVFDSSIVDVLKQNFTPRYSTATTKESEAKMIKDLMIMKPNKMFVVVSEENGLIHGFIVAQAMLELQSCWIHQMWSGFRSTNKRNKFVLRCILDWAFENFNIIRLRGQTEIRHENAMKHLGWRKVATIREFMLGD